VKTRISIIGDLKIVGLAYSPPTSTVHHGRLLMEAQHKISVELKIDGRGAPISTNCCAILII
jgi:hypothetical protein